jgi:hypothetical protein
MNDFGHILKLSASHPIASVSDSESFLSRLNVFNSNRGSIMKRDSKLPVVAKVDVTRVSLTKKKSLGIDFSNEIDVWAKMQFRAREQVKRLERNQTLDGHDILQDLNTLVYAVRTKIE